MEGIALFSTPVFVHQEPGVEALCAEASAALIAERARTPSLQVSNHGGAWHSVPDLARRPDPVWQAIVGLIMPRVREAFDAVARSNGHDTRALPLDQGVQMWGMVMDRGGYATLHEHHDASWSIAFYADAGDPGEPPAGALSLVDPRRVPAQCAGVTIYPSTFTLRPRTGMLVVFPGWLQHYVHAYDGTRPRVTLSANVRLDPTRRA